MRRLGRRICIQPASTDQVESTTSTYYFVLHLLQHSPSLSSATSLSGPSHSTDPNLQLHYLHEVTRQVSALCSTSLIQRLPLSSTHPSSTPIVKKAIVNGQGSPTSPPSPPSSASQSADASGFFFFYFFSSLRQTGPSTLSPSCGPARTRALHHHHVAQTPRTGWHDPDHH